MSQDWMIEVLRDLRCFARQNSYFALAEQLDDTIHVAVAEITSRSEAGVVKDGERNGSVSRTRGAM